MFFCELGYDVFFVFVVGVNKEGWFFCGWSSVSICVFVSCFLFVLLVVENGFWCFVNSFIVYVLDLFDKIGLNVIIVVCDYCQVVG